MILEIRQDARGLPPNRGVVGDDEEVHTMPEGITGAVLAFCWGLAAASGVLGGTILGLIARLPHRAIAAIMSFGAAVLVSAASISIRMASEALIVAGAVSTGGGIIAGAATFSIANAALATARDRKRCGECKPQLSEAEAPGSGKSIAIGTALDAVPEALVLGITLRVSGPDVALVVALALSNVSEALSATAGMRLASRSCTYVLSLWSGIALGTAATTALALYLLSELGPDLTAALKAFGAGALIAMAAETMIPEAFHNGPRYSGVLAASGVAAPILLSEVAK
jgi:ZIP family zinc transporter